MIPIRDTIPSKRYPVVNLSLIGISVLIYLLQLTQGNDLGRFVYIYGLVPARYVDPQIGAYFSVFQQLFSLLSFMFLHGGFMHLLMNMWSLYIFGDNVEDSMGPFRYLAFYLLCGLVSGLAHMVINTGSNVPTIGASGALAGVMGAYFLLHPRAKILTLIPIIIIPWFVEIPAFFFLGFWFVMQFLNAAGAGAAASGIAWWAHIGGFVCGMAILKLFLVVPAQGVSERVGRLTTKKKTHRLQVIRPAGLGNDPNLYGTIAISGFERLAGAVKMVNIPWGFHNRVVRVTIPAGIREGSFLRLKEMGKITPEGGRGDLMLKVTVTGDFS